MLTKLSMYPQSCGYVHAATCLLSPQNFKGEQSLSTLLTFRSQQFLMMGCPVHRSIPHLCSLDVNSILPVITAKNVSKYYQMSLKSSWIEDHWCGYPNLSISYVSGKAKQYFFLSIEELLICGSLLIEYLPLSDSVLSP